MRVYALEPHQTDKSTFEMQGAFTGSLSVVLEATGSTINPQMINAPNSMSAEICTTVAF